MTSAAVPEQPQQLLAPSIPGASKRDNINGVSQKATRISHACQMCKIRKTKCDGKIPCWRCTTRQTDCNYDSSDRRRARSILLKDFNAIRENMRSYDKLMDIMRNSDDQFAQHALGLIRSKSSIQEIVQQLEDEGSDSPNSQSTSPDVSVTDGVLKCGRPKQSSAVSDGSANNSFDGAAAKGFGSPSGGLSLRANLSHSPTLQSSPGSVDSNLTISALRPHPTLSKIAGTNGLDILQITLDAGCVEPVRSFNLWSKPWTSITDDNAIVSHLISLCSTWTQSMHSFFDLDAFIGDASSCRPNSRYCSPLLFNSLLAISCLFCIHDVAFVDPLEPMSRGEHFIAEAKKFLSHGKPNGSLTMENLTRLQSLPLIALFEASRMRTAAAWYYTTWFFNVCVELGLPDLPNEDHHETERWRLGQMAVSYAIFLTDRLWFTYTTAIQKLFLSGEPPYSIASLFPTSSIASRRATIGPCSVTPLFADSVAAATTNTNPSNHTQSRRGSRQSTSRPSILRIDTDMHNNDASGDQSCRFDLNTLICKLQSLMTSNWDDSTMAELLMLHGKLQAWLKASSGGSSGASNCDSEMTDSPRLSDGAVDPGFLQLSNHN